MLHQDVLEDHLQVHFRIALVPGLQMLGLLCLEFVPQHLGVDICPVVLQVEGQIVEDLRLLLVGPDVYERAVVVEDDSPYFRHRLASLIRFLRYGRSSQSFLAIRSSPSAM